MVRRLGEYELLQEIGRGGMGVVYKARHTGLGRVVALKVLRAGQMASAQDVERFRAEARAAAGLDHPHIVPIYEVGEADGEHYFTMRLVEGANLGESLARLRGDLPAAVRTLALVARAVGHAHQQGIIHRDLKPANILLDANGFPQVCDFGLARRIQDECSATTTGVVLGTADYIAPEQAAGRKKLTPAADVYSLGAILYEVLTGRPPFPGRTPLDVLRRASREELVTPRSLNPAVPRGLEAICVKCLEKNPQHRYESAEALADDLDRWLRGEPVRAGRFASLRRFLRRHRAGCAVLMLAGVLAAGPGMISWQAVRHDLTYDSDMDEAREAWQQGNYGAVRDLLHRHAGWLDHRDDEWRDLSRQFQQVERYGWLFTLEGPPLDGHFQRRKWRDMRSWWRWSPDSRRLFFVRNEGPIVLDAETGREVSDPAELALVANWNVGSDEEITQVAPQIRLSKLGETLPFPYKRLSDEHYRVLCDCGRKALANTPSEVPDDGVSEYWIVYWSGDGKKVLSHSVLANHWNVWDARDWKDWKGQ
jgi:tRNA A-37 threonylcarbamoyl transferase component Bud32